MSRHISSVLVSLITKLITQKVPFYVNPGTHRQCKIRPGRGNLPVEITKIHLEMNSLLINSLNIEVSNCASCILEHQTKSDTS